MGVSQSLPAGVWASVDAALPGSLAEGGKKKKKCARACVRGIAAFCKLRIYFFFYIFWGAQTQ